jgi:hypothetical protein
MTPFSPYIVRPLAEQLGKSLAAKIPDNPDWNLVDAFRKYLETALDTGQYTAEFKVHELPIPKKKRFPRSLSHSLSFSKRPLRISLVMRTCGVTLLVHCSPTT